MATHAPASEGAMASGAAVLALAPHAGILGVRVDVAYVRLDMPAMARRQTELDHAAGQHKTQCGCKSLE